MAMTLYGVSAAPTRPTLLSGAADWPLVLLVWGVYALSVGLRGFSGSIDALSTDDAMRLAEVRDLLAGQGWFDLVQHRLNPPDGVAMHWSRLIDLPIALILMASERALPADAALKLTLTAWPLLLLLPALFAAAAASRAIAGLGAGVVGAVLLALSPGVLGHFAPGAIDHHGAQIALALAMFACAARIDRSARAGLGAGLCAAAMTAIGMETAPHVAACAGLLALRWAISGEPAVARGVRAFGLAFAGGTALVMATTVAPALWTAPVCDALGIGQLLGAGIGGAGLALATRIAAPGPAPRFACLAIVALAVAAAVALAAPNCLASPYAGLPERLKTDWLANVQEAQTFVAAALYEPTAAFAIGFAFVGLLAAAGFALATAPRGTRWPVWTAAALFAAACCVTMWQVRGSGLAFALGTPLLAAAVVAIGAGGGRVRTILAVTLINPTTLALAGLGLAGALGFPAIDGPAVGKRCPVSDYRALGREPAGLALNTTDTGPYLIAFTPHGAVAAPYHRNVDGLMADLEAFGGTEEAARAIALSRRAAYVVACPTDGGVTPAARAAPEGFSEKLLSKAPPSWLEPIDLGPGTRLKAWRVTVGR